MNYQQHVNLHSSLHTEKDYSKGSSVFKFYSNYFFYTSLKIVCSLYEQPRAQILHLHFTTSPGILSSLNLATKKSVL